MNNVAARATGGTTVDKRGYPTAQMWTEPPRGDESGREKRPGPDDADAPRVSLRNDDGNDETSAENGENSKAPGGVDGVTAPLPQEKKKPEM